VAFVHLHRHSEFSRLDGIGTAKSYAAEAARLGQGALALTDHGTLSGALHHVAACKGKDDKGKKIHDPLLPITGVEAYFRPNRLLAKKFKQRNAWHLCLFAKNLKGWHSLLQIVSTAFQDPMDGGGFYQYPCVDFELLKRYREGLVCSSACVSSYIAELIQGGDDVAVNEYIDQMLSIFGDDFWLELMPHDFKEQVFLNQILVDIARDRSIPLIATNDAHFPVKEWAETQRVAKLCGINSSFQKLEKEKEKGKSEYLGDLHPSLYIASEAEMREWFRRHHPMIRSEVAEEAIQNTALFTSRITPFMLDKTDKLPKSVEDEGDDPEKILRAWIEEGWQKLLVEYPESHWEKWPKQVYLDRIESEWQILKSKGVIDYFVLVGDLVRWAKSANIRVGLGRGSAAGCLISYLVGIVAIDPISWGLLFERFLNPERKGLPDIDLDFQSDRRHEVKERAQKKKWCKTAIMLTSASSTSQTSSRTAVFSPSRSSRHWAASSIFRGQKCRRSRTPSRFARTPRRPSSKRSCRSTSISRRSSRSTPTSGNTRCALRALSRMQASTRRASSSRLSRWPTTWPWSAARRAIS
jgi:DNA polymerase-3 subunit alpha